MARIARARWRPLPQNATAAVIKPRLIIVHTMVGSQLGSEAWFKNPAARGVESTFGIGGPTDLGLDGVIFQWMDTTRQADCNLNANGISVSIEMSDGGKPARPFSPKQLEALTALIVDLCRAHGIPPTLAKRWDGTGLGYHQLFVPQWNRTHDCPGTVRRVQLLTVVFPEVARRMKPPAPVKEPAVAQPKYDTFKDWYGDWFGPVQSLIHWWTKARQYELTATAVQNQQLTELRTAVDALSTTAVSLAARVAALESQNGAPTS